MNRPRKIAFGYYGGKYSHLGWLLPLLPQCNHYCEPFGGSAAVLLNREPSPIETYNDIDGEVVNFFRVLRNEPDRLINALRLTPYSREEFALACEPDPSLDSFERARRFFVRVRQSRMCKPQVIKSQWSFSKNHSNRNVSSTVSKFFSSINGLEDVASRLLRVQLENKDAFDVIRLYDTPSTLFYCDPPYVLKTRVEKKSYLRELSDKDHCELAFLLNSLSGRVAVSGYDCDLMNELYPSPKWRKNIGPTTKISTGSGGIRTELLWTNYDPPVSDMSQLDIFAKIKGDDHEIQKQTCGG